MKHSAPSTLCRILGWCGLFLLFLLPNLSFAQPLGGRVTVGWGRQFTNLNDAIARLNQYGDSSAVTLVLDSGWHNLERNLERTLQYPLTIVSNDRDSSSTFIYGYGSRQYPYREIFLGSNSYIFKHLTFTPPWGPPTDEYQGLYFIGSKGLQIDSCSVSSFYYTGSGSLAFQGTTFHNAISVNPDTSHSQLKTIRIRQCAYRYSAMFENLASNSNRFGMYFSKAQHVSIDDFKVSIPKVTLSPYGTVFNLAQMDSVEISRMRAVSCYLIINLSYIKNLYVHDNVFHTSYEDSSYGGSYGTGSWDNIWNTVYYGDVQLHSIKKGRIENNILTHQGATNLWAISHSLVYRQPSSTLIAGDENLRIANNTISGHYFGINHLAFTQDPRSPRSNTTTIEHNTIHVKRIAIHIPSTGLSADSFMYDPYPQYPTYFRILRNTIKTERYGLHIQGPQGLIASNYIEADTGLFYGDARLKIFGNTLRANRCALYMYGFVAGISLRQNILYSQGKLVHTFLYPGGGNLYTIPGGENMYHSPLQTPFYYTGHYINKQEYDFDRIQWVNPADRRSLWDDPGFVLPGSPTVTNARLAPAPTDTLAYNTDIDSLSRLPINFYGCKKPSFCPQNLALKEIIPDHQGSSHQYRAVVRNVGSLAMSGTRLYGQLNENPPVPMAVPSLAPGQSDTIRFPAWTADSAQILRFRAYLSGPTQFQDCSAADDTLRHVRYPARYCGSYTVGGVQASFPSLYVALYRLNVAGLRCPVELRLRPGIHPCTIGFDTCPGLSDTNSLTFRADQGDSSKVRILPGAWTGQKSEDILLAGIHFKDITFDSLSLGFGLISGSFKNCHFENITDTKYLGKVMFKNCTFEDSIVIDKKTNLPIGRTYSSYRDTLMFVNCQLLEGITLMPTLNQEFRQLTDHRAPVIFDSCHIIKNRRSALIWGMHSTRSDGYDTYYRPHKPFEIKNCRIESYGPISCNGIIRSLDWISMKNSRYTIQGYSNICAGYGIVCGYHVEYEVAVYENWGFCSIRNSQIETRDSVLDGIYVEGRLRIDSSSIIGFNIGAYCRERGEDTTIIANSNIIHTSNIGLNINGGAYLSRNLINSGIPIYSRLAFEATPNIKLVANNILVGRSTCIDTEDGSFVNNTMLSSGDYAAVTRRNTNSYYPCTTSLRNSIIISKVRGVVLSIGDMRGFSSSHNILHTSGPILARIGDTVYHSLDSLQAHGYEQGSLAVDPYLSADSIPVPLNPAVADQGTYIPGLRTDYFGHPRDTLSPDPGAVEMGPGPRLARLLAPAHTCSLSAAEAVSMQMEAAYPGVILAYRLDSGLVWQDTLAQPVSRYTFRHPVDLAGAGIHQLRVWIVGRRDTLLTEFKTQALPQPILSATVGCLKDSVVFQAVVATGTFPGPVWLFFGDGDSARGPRAHHLYTRPALYQSSVRVYSADSSCFTLATAPIQTKPNPRAAFTIHAACLDRPLDIQNQSLSPDTSVSYKYLWTLGDGRQDTAVHPSPVYSTVGTYRISLQVTDLAGCQDTSSTWVDLRPAPSIQISPPAPLTLIPGVPLLLQASSTGGSIRWNTGSTDTLLRVSSPGPYYATAIASGWCQTRSDTVWVRVLQPLTLSLGPNRLGCEGDTFRLSGPPGMAYYQWSQGDSTRTLSVTQSGTFSLTVSDSLGRRATAQVVVRIKPRQTVSYQIPPGPHCRADSPFRVGTSISYFRFEGNSITTAGVVDPTQADTVIDFRLIPTDTSVCSDTASGRIYIHSNPPAPSFTDYFYALCMGDTIRVWAEPPSMRLLWTDGTSFPTPRPLYRPGRYTAWAISDSGCPSPQAWPLQLDSVGTLPLPGILRSGDTLRAVDNAPQVNHYWERYLFGFNLPDANFNGFGNPSFVLADQPGTYVLYSTSPPLCRRVDSLIVSTIATIHHRETGLSLFPSPVDDVLTLHASPGTSIVSLSDPLGRTLPVVTQEPHRISVKHVPSGTYILHVRESDGTLRHLPFVKR